MSLAIFGITNDGLNLAVSLFVLMSVVVWFALIVYTYMDAQRRIEDPVLVACATAASLFPYIGTAVYSILRPPDFLDDVRERELEIKAAELRVRQLSEQSCQNCGFPVEKNYLRCPNCQRRLKDPCHSCGQPVDPRWALCPYCEKQLPGRAQPQPPASRQPKRSAERRPERSGAKRTATAPAADSQAAAAQAESRAQQARAQRSEQKAQRSSRKPPAAAGNAADGASAQTGEAAAEGDAPKRRSTSRSPRTRTSGRSQKP